MADFNSVAQFVTSPPIQVVAGTVVGGFVMKAFEKWETLASKSDKIQVWMWLAQPQIAIVEERWPQTFTRLFDRVFGEKHLSWRCFRRSCVATLISCAISVLGIFAYLRPFVYTPFPHEKPISGVGWFLSIPVLVVAAAVVLCSFDYLSLLETRIILRLLQRSSSWYRVLTLLLVDIVITGVTGSIPIDLLFRTFNPIRITSQSLAEMNASTAEWIQQLESERAELLVKVSKMPEVERRIAELNRQSAELQDRMRNKGYGKAELQLANSIHKERSVLNGELSHDYRRELVDVEQEIAAVDMNQKSGYEQKKFLIQELSFWLPAFFTSFWLWLYAGCGLFLKAARRLDIGFQWFTRHFDVENRPLQSIGFVAGMVVTMVWWAVALVARYV